MKSLEEYIETNLASLGSYAIESYKEVIDEMADKVYQDMLDHTPTATGKLKSTLTKRVKNHPTRYGYTIDYEGYREDGTPYSLIARSLNKGVNGVPTCHISNAVRKLKGIDKKINTRFRSKIKKQHKKSLKGK